MTVAERQRAVTERQQELTPREDLSRYAGQWVALRDGRVVASALDAISLRQSPVVRSDDVLMPVPRHGMAINVL